MDLLDDEKKILVKKIFDIKKSNLNIKNNQEKKQKIETLKKQNTNSADIDTEIDFFSNNLNFEIKNLNLMKEKNDYSNKSIEEITKELELEIEEASNLRVKSELLSEISSEKKEEEINLSETEPKSQYEKQPNIISNVKIAPKLQKKISNSTKKIKMIIKI